MFSHYVEVLAMSKIPSQCNRVLLPLTYPPAVTVLLLQVAPGSSKFRLESGQTKTRDGKTGVKAGDLCRSLLEELDSTTGAGRYC